MISIFSMGRNGGMFISAARGRSRPEMPAPFDSLNPSFYIWSVGIFSLSLSVRKYYFMFSIWLQFPIGAQKFRVFADFRLFTVIG